MNQVYHTRCAAQTEDAGSRFAECLSAGDAVRLHGDIGVGKTVFVRGIAKIFGDASEVCSPTFSIMNIYAGKIPVYHFDLYRLEEEDEIYEAGLTDYICGDGVSVIEWPDRLSHYENSVIYDVFITKNLEIDDDYREIRIVGGSVGQEDKQVENSGG